MKSGHASAVVPEDASRRTGAQNLSVLWNEKLQTSDVNGFFLKVSSSRFRPHLPLPPFSVPGGGVNDCGSAASRACWSHKDHAYDHQDRIAQSGCSPVCRLNAKWRMSRFRLGYRSTVFVYRLYADECADRHVLVGWRSKTSLAACSGDDGSNQAVFIIGIAASKSACTACTAF